MKLRKGVELPTNTVIVLALGIFVLVLVVLYVARGFNPLADASADSAVNQGCQKYAQMGGSPEIAGTLMVGDIDNDGKGDTLLKACQMSMKNPTMNAAECVNVCASKFPNLIERVPIDEETTD
jgi:hypothetical protein